MCTYLKNMEGKKLKDLKNKSFDSIQKMFDRAFKRVNTFVDFRTDLVEGSSKRAGEELEQESTKKQKVDEDKDTTELQSLMEVIPDEEEVAIDVVPLAIKSPSIVGWKIHKEGKKSYYQIMRADGKSQMYRIFSHMLKSFSKEDLYKLGDLKTMFEPHVEDTVWRNQQDYKVLEWKLYDSCRVHSLRMQHVYIYMLVEKRYPLTPSTITDMLNKKLQYKVNAAEGVNAASEEVSTAELIWRVAVLKNTERKLIVNGNDLLVLLSPKWSSDHAKGAGLNYALMAYSSSSSRLRVPPPTRKFHAPQIDLSSFGFRCVSHKSIVSTDKLDEEVSKVIFGMNYGGQSVQSLLSLRSDLLGIVDLQYANEEHVYLTDYEEIDEGYVLLKGNPKEDGNITGKCTIKMGILTEEVLLNAQPQRIWKDLDFHDVNIYKKSWPASTPMETQKLASRNEDGEKFQSLSKVSPRYAVKRKLIGGYSILGCWFIIIACKKRQWLPDIPTDVRIKLITAGSQLMLQALNFSIGLILLGEVNWINYQWESKVNTLVDGKDNCHRICEKRSSIEERKVSEVSKSSNASLLVTRYYTSSDIDSLKHNEIDGFCNKFTIQSSSCGEEQRTNPVMRLLVERRWKYGKLQKWLQSVWNGSCMTPGEYYIFEDTVYADLHAGRKEISSYTTCNYRYAEQEALG
ncbi:hypothetical protein Tco_0641293 [Tanacetum coccineum]